MQVWLRSLGHKIGGGGGGVHKLFCHPSGCGRGEGAKISSETEVRSRKNFGDSNENVLDPHLIPKNNQAGKKKYSHVGSVAAVGGTPNAKITARIITVHILIQRPTQILDILP